MRREVYQDNVLIESIEYFKFEDLEEYKKYLIAKVSLKRDEDLLASGFQFDGHTFSLSEQAKLKWSNIPNFPEMIFPQSITTSDDYIYELSFANKMNFYYAALMAVKTKEDECGEKIKQIKLLTTLQECEDFENTL